MLMKIFKWIGIVLGGLLVLAVVAVVVLYIRGNSRLTKKYDVQVESLVIPTDQESIAQGKKWAAVLCADCHGQDYSGQPLVDEKMVGFVPAPNLTPGEGGAGGEFTDLDWVGALRDGVDPEGRALIGMPSMNFAYLTDRDLGGLIAYIKSIPPVDHEMGEPAMTFMGKTLLAAGAFGKNILPAEVIDHQGKPPSVDGTDVHVGFGKPDVETGAYLVRVIGCRDCHGENLTGGKSPEPGAPYAPDLTYSGVGGTWSSETFIAAAHTMSGRGMPWIMLKPLDDSQLQAILNYLHSLPGK